MRFWIATLFAAGTIFGMSRGVDARPIPAATNLNQLVDGGGLIARAPAVDSIQLAGHCGPRHPSRHYRGGYGPYYGGPRAAYYGPGYGRGYRSFYPPRGYYPPYRGGGGFGLYIGF